MKVKYSFGFVIFVASLFLSVSFTFAYDIKEYLPLQEGNSWKYNESVDNNMNEKGIEVSDFETVNGTETVKLLYSNGDYDYVAFDSEGLKKYKFSEEDSFDIYAPSRLLYPDINEGEQKIILINITSFSSDGSKREYDEKATIKLETVEEVTVPAGIFSGCLKFSTISDLAQKNGNTYFNVDTVTWLAPGVGVVKEFSMVTETDAETKKERTYTTVSELVSAIIQGNSIGD